MNNQLIEKRHLTADGLLDVHSIFHTIQGEGPFRGTPAVFIRLAGCNLQCPACDTDYTSKRSLRTVKDIAGEVAWKDLTVTRPAGPLSRGLVVITGGEPFRQNIAPLLRALENAGFYVQVETNGTLAAPENFVFSRLPDLREGVYVVCSPKAGKVHQSIELVACAYKYVLAANSVSAHDGLPLQALAHPSAPYVARPPAGWSGVTYLQPLDVGTERGNADNLEATIVSCMRFGYTLQLQIHKIINME